MGSQHGGSVKKLSKTERYRQRLQDQKHQFKMYIEPEYFRQLHKTKNTTALAALRGVCRDFNDTVESLTRDQGYSVLLNIGISEIAADYYYVFKGFKRWCEEQGCIEKFKDMLPIEAHELYGAIRPAKPSNFVGFEADQLLDLLPKLSRSALPVLLYMKCRCSRPNTPGGVTDLKNETIAEGLGIHRTNVSAARKILENLGIIEIIYKNKLSDGNKIATYTKYLIKI
jgi:hypothetical protein